MSGKTPWEQRVGMLLDPEKHPDDFVWSFKPPDSAMYGGQPRIDWLACDRLGYFWGIEVKSLAAGRRSLNLLTDVSAGQRDALSAIDRSTHGRALLAVGTSENHLYFYFWRDIAWLLDGKQKPLLQVPDLSFMGLLWTGPKAWATYSIVNHVIPALTERYYPTKIPVVAVPLGSPSGMSWMPPQLTVPSSPPVPSPSISKPRDSIRTRRKKRLSEL